LRTPLNAIIGYSELVREEAEDEGDEGSVADLRKIESASQHLLELINQILDFSKIEAGRMLLSIEPLSAAKMVESVDASATCFAGTSRWRRRRPGHDVRRAPARAGRRLDGRRGVNRPSSCALCVAFSVLRSPFCYCPPRRPPACPGAGIGLRGSFSSRFAAR
jgi:signal transduction histidine kinase